MTSARIRSVDEIVASVRTSRLPASSSPRVPPPYGTKDIKTPWLRDVINLTCDAEAILSRSVRFEPSQVNLLRDRLRKYDFSLAQQYAARLDNLGYVVDLSEGTLTGQVDFDLRQVQGLIKELEPFADASGEIRRLHNGLTIEYGRRATGEIRIYT